ncbi:hypothetical protein [Polynucleobacter sp. MWH-UH23A]|uniref:hypothetical protein n=1 Tax=Polynucleobacter sp. MWH-UH23A TaxID=1855613 RepID=UPI003364B6B7
MNLKYFIFVDFETAGHHFDYAKNFQVAVSSENFKVQFIVLQGLPNKFSLKEWYPVIQGGRSRQKSLNKRFNRFASNTQWVFSAMPSFISSISRIIEDGDIVFLEDFSYSELCAFIVALLFSNKKELLLSILFRYSVNQSIIKYVLYKFLFLIVNLLFREVIYFSDSNLLSNSWEKIVKRRVTTFPIPNRLDYLAHNKPPRIFWWPGYPREDKGLNRIIKILSEDHRISDAKFILSEDVRKFLKNTSLRIEYIDPILSTDKYLSTFQRVRYVILPYDKIRYSKSTSGVFVEAVLLGCIPVVEHGTWMAQELDKFGLMDLIVDFNYFDLSDFVQNIESNIENIEFKLQVMGKFYARYHTVDSYRDEFFHAISCAFS